MPAWKTLWTTAAAVAMTACSETPPPEPPPAAASTASAAVMEPPVATAASAAEVPVGWLGKWQGPEGTWLEITGGSGTYRVTVQNLDGARSFDAKAGTGTLVFVRDGTIETIRTGSGTDTGMKWLADKRDCLVVKTGEGYCRG